MKGGLKKITVAITGASGTAYGAALVEALSRSGHQVFLIVSKAGEEVMRLEEGRDVQSLVGEGVRLFQENDFAAPLASGSFPVDAMVIIPCTMSTLSAVASGRADNLIHRAADVTLKEGRRLILVPRETALNRIHLENMLRAHDAGAVIMPAMPAFYGRPGTVDDLVRHLAGRVLDRLGIGNDLAPRWGGA